MAEEHEFVGVAIKLDRNGHYEIYRIGGDLDKLSLAEIVTNGRQLAYATKAAHEDLDRVNKLILKNELVLREPKQLSLKFEVM